jgi:eukaryotic-like serine/threonine-protein kinase
VPRGTRPRTHSNALNAAARDTAWLVRARRAGVRARSNYAGRTGTRHGAVLGAEHGGARMSAESPFRGGEMVAGKYRITRRLGAGGMGMVFAADHVDLGRPVALKVLLPETAANEAGITRLLREARAAARLTSPHVAKVLDVGRLDSGVPYLVMELLEGQDLQEVLTERGKLSVSDAADYLLEACEALAEAHRAGIVHRDLKPANLFLTTDAYGERCVKLLDFGVSKVQTPEATGDIGLTGSGTLLGSPAYMSPEQMRAPRDVDHRSDIWALGAILFELVSGRVAWTGETLSEICVKVASDPAPRLRSVAPDAPKELDAIVARCLEKDPARRYQQVSDLALALGALGSSRAHTTLERILRMGGQDDAALVSTRVGEAPKVAARPATDLTLEGTATVGPERGTPSHRARALVAFSALALLAGALWLTLGGTAPPGGASGARAHADLTVTSSPGSMGAGTPTNQPAPIVTPVIGATTPTVESGRGGEVDASRSAKAHESAASGPRGRARGARRERVRTTPAPEAPAHSAAPAVPPSDPMSVRR